MIAYEFYVDDLCRIIDGRHDSELVACAVENDSPPWTDAGVSKGSLDIHGGSPSLPFGDPVPSGQWISGIGVFWCSFPIVTQQFDRDDVHINDI
jgi:hypothetical protein